MNGLILEGIPAVGKSCALQALRACPEFQQRLSTLILSEHYTERAVEHVEEVAPVRYERLMYRLLAALEPLRVLGVEGPVFADGGAKARLRYVFERFHLTNILAHANGDLAMLHRVENTLRVYQPVTVLLTVDPAEIEPRLQDTLARRNPGWQTWLLRQGRDLPAVAAHFADQQQRYRELLAAASLPGYELNVSELGYETVALRLNASLDDASA